MRGVFRKSCVAVLACLTAPAFAQTPVEDFSLAALIGWSDNIRGVYADPESETIAGVGMRARVSREHRRLNFDLFADLQYLEYLHDTFDSQVTGFAAFQGSAVLVPEVLTLGLEDNFGQAESTPFSPSTPETRQNINVAAVGPDLRIEMGDALVLLASGRFIMEEYEITPADNTRQRAHAGLYHEFSDDSSIGVLGVTTHVDYDEDSTGSDFDRNEALVRYQVSARRTAMLLEGGFSEYSADDGTEREMWLYRIDVARQITARTRLSLETGRELSDSGSLFVGQGQSADPGGNSVGSLADSGLGMAQLTSIGIFATTDALAHRYLRAGWHLNASRTRAYLGAEHREERYLQGSVLDRDVRSYSAGGERDLNSVVRLGLDITHVTRESLDSAIVAKDLMVRASAFWRAARRIEFELFAESSRREDDSTGGGFDDNRIQLRVNWSPRGATN